MTSRSLPPITRHRARRAAPSILIASLLTACGGGGGGSSAPPASELSDLSYEVDSASFLVGVPIDPLEATIEGTPSLWTVVPPLPDGLAIHPVDGTIHGTPTSASAAAEHVVTASNAVNAVEVPLRLAAERPPRFALVANAADETLSVYRVDAYTGRLDFHGYVDAPAGQGSPIEVVAHPGGQLAFVLHQVPPGGASAVVTAYAVEPGSGELELAEEIAVGAGCSGLALSDDGSTLYVTNSEMDAVVVYALALDAGGKSVTVTELGSVQTGSQPDRIVLDPLGEFAFVANRGSRSISIYAVDGETGMLADTVSTTDLAGGVPSDLALDSAGEALLVTLENFDLVTLFTLDRATHALAVAQIRATEARPTSVDVHPTGRFAYVAGSDSGRVSGYALDAPAGILEKSYPAFDIGAGEASVRFGPAGLHAYATSAGSHDLTACRVERVSGAAEDPSVIRGRGAPAALTFVQGLAPIEKRTRWLYALNRLDESVSSYSVSPSDGSLTETGPPVLTGADPLDLENDPRGRFLYVVQHGAASVRTFRVDPQTGALSLALDSEVIAQPTALSADPSGAFVYLTCQGEDAVASYAVAPDTGALSLVEGRLLTSKDAVAAAVDPTGQFLYVATTTDVLGFKLSRGEMVEGPFTLPTANGEPTSFTFSPSGERLYATLAAHDLAAGFWIHPATGHLSTPVAKETPATPRSIALHPGGGFAFATTHDSASDGTVRSFLVQPDNGALVDNGEVAVGIRPLPILADIGGNYCFVANEGGGDISLLAIAPDTGELSEQGVVAAGEGPIDLVAFEVLQ